MVEDKIEIKVLFMILYVDVKNGKLIRRKKNKVIYKIVFKKKTFIV